MLKTVSDSCEIFIGKNAGDDIYSCIKNAKKSITILSPYVSPEYILLLTEAFYKGLDVLLLTGSDMSSNEKTKNDIYRNVLIQYQHLNKKAKKFRIYGLIISLLLLISAIGCGIWGYKTGKNDLLWSFVAVPILWKIFVKFKNKRIYFYTYEPIFDFGVFISPYDKKIDEAQYFIHSKIYIIDEKIAFVGSVNFTKNAFRTNYECYVKIEDPNTVTSISHEIKNLTQSEGTFYKDFSVVGRRIYTEPPN